MVRLLMTASLRSRPMAVLKSVMAIAGAALVGLLPAETRADQSTFRIYDRSHGLSNVDGACLVQDRAGFVLVCSQHGVFAYDGRTFVSLGVSQGLRDGGEAFDIALTSSGRIAVMFADEVYVSDQASDASHPPSLLSFHPVPHPGVTLYAGAPRRMTSWGRGLAFLAGSLPLGIAVPESGPARVETIGYDRAERPLLDGAARLFSVQDGLWATFADGRICRADPGAVKCYGTADGLDGEEWVALAAGPGGRVTARSASAAASLDAATGRWSVTALPDQDGRYGNYGSWLGLFTAPDGSLFTQAEHGLAVLKPDGWRVVSTDEGAPAGIITSALTDATGQLWFQALGVGLVRQVGYGRWETVQKAEKLADAIPWRSVRGKEGSLWVTTDSGVQELVGEAGSLHAGRILQGASFAIAVGPRGELWHGSADGVSILKSPDGPETSIKLPQINAIAACSGETVWLGTHRGLFVVDDRDAAHLQPRRLGSSEQPVGDLLCDGADGAFYLTEGRLHHRHGDGRDVTVYGLWPADGFVPSTMTFGRDGSLWIGGEGGLRRLVLADDSVTSFEAASTEDIRSSDVVAVMVDHRGWVWAGTDLGVSVFDGRRWVSVDTEAGLMSDDVNDGGIREDPDGSMWITTTQGLSHLLDPSWVFENRPIDALVSRALLGARPVTGDPFAYTEDALSLQFGTSAYASERSIVFRYQLSGVDAEPVQSASGAVRYAFVPPGRHVLEVVAYDKLTHRSSPPTTLVVDVGYPWWRQSWAETLWAVLAAGAVQGFVTLRLRKVSAREAELKRLVLQATEKLRLDSLTGLLNRYEIERRLAERLACVKADDEVLVALLDIDHFKRVNDAYGHLGGDDVLRVVGALVSGTLRSGECAGRYGGEEMLLILEDADGRGAERLLNLHSLVRGTSFGANGRSIRLTCSIGLTWAVRGDDWDSLIGRADDALYEAKASGRDRVVERPRDLQVVRTAVNERRSSPETP